MALNERKKIYEQLRHFGLIIENVCFMNELGHFANTKSLISFYIYKASEIYRPRLPITIRSIGLYTLKD